MSLATRVLFDSRYNVMTGSVQYAVAFDVRESGRLTLVVDESAAPDELSARLRALADRIDERFAPRTAPVVLPADEPPFELALVSDDADAQADRYKELGA